MTKVTLALLLGAFTASSWWAVARWCTFGPKDPGFPIMLIGIMASVGCIAWIVTETERTHDK